MPIYRESGEPLLSVLALIASTQSAGADVLAALNWEEVVY